MSYEEYKKEEENVVEEPKEKGGRAKKASLCAKIIGAVYILTASTLSFLGIFSAPVSDICIVGFSIMGIFGTVDINLMLDKFTKKGD